MGQSCCAQHTFDTHELDNLARTRYMKTHPNCEIERELTSLSSELLDIAINKTKLRSRKLILITAATSPIGRALCAEFASKSSEYIVCGIATNTKHVKQMTDDLDKISSTIKSISSLTAEDEAEENDIDTLSATSSEDDNEHDDDPLFIPQISCVDVCNEKKVALWIMDIFEEYGIPDIIINNSTIIQNSNNDEELTYDEFVNISDTNVTAYFHLLKYLMPSLIKNKKGTIINLTGTSQSIPTVFKTAYETSKFAMEGYVESLSDKLFKEKSKLEQTQSLPHHQPQKNIKITSNFNISFVTMSVGSLDMKSQRILCGFTDNNKQNDDLKKELLDDRKEEENNGIISNITKSQQDKVEGVTFQRWAAKTLPIITNLSENNNNKSCSIYNKYKSKSNQSNGYANVDRIVDLNTMLKSKYSK